MADQSISQLPVATTLTGDELTVVVQNGITKQTQVADIANAVAPGKFIDYLYFDTGSDLIVVYTDTTTQNLGPIPGYIAASIRSDGHLILTNSTGGTTDAGSVFATLSQTFITKNNESATLPNSQQLIAGSNIALSYGTNSVTISASGASGSLNGAGTGIIVKDTSTSVVARTLTSTAGISITNPDGIAGNPVISPSSKLANIQNLATTGILAVVGGTTVVDRNIVGTASQITVVGGDGSANPTISIASNPVLPGTGSVTIPTGTTGQRPGNLPGQLRFNSTLNVFEGQDNAGVWKVLALGGGVTSITLGTGLTGSPNPITDTGTISITNTGVTAGSYIAPTITVNAQGQITTATAGSALTIGTGLTGTSYNTSAPVTISITNTGVAAATYGSATQVPQIAINAQGQITSASNITITAGGIGAITAVNGTAGEIETSQVGTVVTVGIPNAPTLTGPVKVLGTGVSSITPFSSSMQAWETNVNNYQDVYVRNLNNGSDASSDFVAYNDASDVNSYFIDMGMNSSNFTSTTYPIFTPNSAYLFTGGGTTGQQTDLFIGTSNPNSDIIFFTGDVQVANQRAMFNGTTGNLLLNTSTDTGYRLNVNGTSYFGGAALFGSTLTLNADPTLALQAATKQYVDSAVSTGFTVHAPAQLATAAALPANTYNNGASGVGATLTAVTNGALTVDGVAVTVGNRILVKNQVASSNNGCYLVTSAGSAGTPYILTRTTDFDQAAPGEIANNAYFFVEGGTVNAGSSFVLSQIAAITVGTTPLPFTQFADQLNYVGGTNINVSGLTISLTGTVAATNGGTGTSTVATGDLLYGSGTNTWSKLALGSAYKSLVVNASGTQLEWNAVALNQTTAVSGQLNVSNGGTGASTLTGYLVGNGTSPFTAVATIPNAGLTNSSITINGSSVSLGGSITVTATASNALTIGTGLTGTSYNGSAAVTIALANTAVTTGTYGSASRTITQTVDQQGRLTNIFDQPIAIANTQVSGLGTMSTQNASAVAITGGTINGTTIGATTAAAITGTTITATNYVGISGGTF